MPLPEWRCIDGVGTVSSAVRTIFSWQSHLVYRCFCSGDSDSTFGASCVTLSHTLKHGRFYRGVLSLLLLTRGAGTCFSFPLFHTFLPPTVASTVSPVAVLSREHQCASPPPRSTTSPGPNRGKEESGSCSRATKRLLISPDLLWRRK